MLNDYIEFVKMKTYQWRDDCFRKKIPRADGTGNFPFCYVCPRRRRGLYMWQPFRLGSKKLVVSWTCCLVVLKKKSSSVVRSTKGNFLKYRIHQIIYRHKCMIVLEYFCPVRLFLYFLLHVL